MSARFPSATSTFAPSRMTIRSGVGARTAPANWGHRTTRLAATTCATQHRPGLTHWAPMLPRSRWVRGIPARASSTEPSGVGAGTTLVRSETGQRLIATRPYKSTRLEPKFLESSRVSIPAVRASQTEPSGAGVETAPVSSAQTPRARRNAEFPPAARCQRASGPCTGLLWSLRKGSIKLALE